MEKSKKLGFIALAFAVFCIVTTALAFTNMLTQNVQEYFAIWCPVPGLLSLLFAIYMLWPDRKTASVKVRYDGYVILQNGSNGKYLAFEGNKKVYVTDRSKATLMGQDEAEQIKAESEIPLVITPDQRTPQSAAQSPGSAK